MPHGGAPSNTIAAGATNTIAAGITGQCSFDTQDGAKLHGLTDYLAPRVLLFAATIRTSDRGQ
jgi:hypothetical protein